MCSSLCPLRVAMQLHHMVFGLEFSITHLRQDPNKHLMLMVYDLDGLNFRHLDPYVSGRRL